MATTETKDLHHTVFFDTDPADLYKCIMDARIHSSFTGAPAIISDKEGETFSAFDGYINGKNIVLERGRKIVQTWQAQEEGWPEDHFSEVVFVLVPEGNATRLDFFHTGVPVDVADAIDKGWTEYYWDPLKEFLNR